MSILSLPPDIFIHISSKLPTTTSAKNLALALAKDPERRSQVYAGMSERLVQRIEAVQKLRRSWGFPEIDSSFSKGLRDFQVCMLSTTQKKAPTRKQLKARLEPIAESIKSFRKIEKEVLDRLGAEVYEKSTEEQLSKIQEIKDRGLSFEQASGNWLFSAARKNDLVVIKALLEAGANPNAELTISNNATLTGLVAAKGSREIVDALLKAGLDPNAGCPLHKALNSKNLQAFSLFLQAGSDINALLVEERPLMVAVRKENHEAVQMLLDSPGLDVNAMAAYSGKRALDFAVEKEDLEMTDLLLKAGAIPQHSNGFILLHPVMQNNEPLFHLLSNAGIKFSFPHQNTAALNYAISNKNWSLIKVFLPQEGPLSPKSWVKAFQTGDLQFLGELMEEAQNPNILDLAIRFSEEHVIDFVLSKNVCINRGVLQPPIVAAAERNKTDLVQRLIELGADVFATEPEFGRNAYFFAEKNGNSAVLEALRKKGCSAKVGRGFLGILESDLPMSP